MPRKVRQLIRDLERAGFVDRGGRGSHRNFEHPTGPRVTLSGKPGDDAKPYQEREVQRAVAESVAAEDEDEDESDESKRNES
jgi:predicted RNA binding protein YcfA (HicA-like mRNA interferase family)